MPSQQNRAEQIFAAALTVADTAEREALVQRECAGDDALRAEVESLLTAHEQADAFMLTERFGAPTASSATDEARLSAGAADTDATGRAAAQESRAPSEKSGDRIGRYKLIERIGEGGFGVVWMAEQQEPVRRRVALKIIKLGMDTREVVARFDAERQALALMDHPSIARIFDGSATKSGRPYFVMELVRGVPITTYCDNHRLSVDERLELFLRVCQAVQHAHQKGIIHRDLKPSNVLVTVLDDRPMPKVIDFGIAKAIAQRLTGKTLFTRLHQFLGTPAYMSPEQTDANREDIDTRSDIYSLGVLLYELLTGRTPFDTKKLFEAGYEAILKTIREQEPPKPSTRLTTLTKEELSVVAAGRRTAAGKLGKTMSGELDWIVMKCLEKDRRCRYETATGLAMDIQRHLSHETVMARPPTAIYRWKKFVRRHRTAVAVSVGFVLLLAVATAVSSVLAVWANRQRARAENAETEATDKAHEARESAAEARAVLKFFQDKVLAAARPEGLDGGLGRNATIRAAVEAAESAIALSFTNQRLVEASIRDVLGTTFLDLGEPAKAVKQHERSWQLRQLRLGTNHSETLEAMNNLARAFDEAGQTDEARRLFQQTLELHQATQRTDDADSFTLMNNLALTYLRSGRPADALLLLEKSFQGQRGLRGPNDPETLKAMNNLASTYQKLDRLAEAIALMKETVERRKNVLGPTNPLTVVSINNLAEAYRADGQVDAAVSLLQESLKTLRERLGPTHADTLVNLDNLGVALMEKGELDEAERLLREAVKGYEEKFGSSEGGLYRAQNNLARILEQAGRSAEAAPIYERVLQGVIQLFGSNARETLTVKGNLARALHKAGQPTNALSLMEETVKQSVVALGTGHRDTLLAMNNLSTMLQAADRLADALPLSEKVLSFGELNPGVSHPWTITWRNNLGKVYLDLNRTNDATPLYQRNLTLLVARQAPGQAETMQALDSVAEGFLQLKNFTNAEVAWSELLKQQRIKLRPEDPAYAETACRLAEPLLRQGKNRAAGSLLREYLPLLQKERPATIAALQAESLLGSLLLIEKKYDEAEASLLRAYEGLKRHEADAPSRSRSRIMQETVDRMVQLYEARGQAGKAAEWRQKLR